MSRLSFVATCVRSEPSKGPDPNGPLQLNLGALRYEFATKHPMLHFPLTLDTHLYFNIEISGSDLADAELANRPDAFKEFVFIIALR